MASEQDLTAPCPICEADPGECCVSLPGHPLRRGEVHAMRERIAGRMREVEAVRCSQCGGPLTLRRGDHVVLGETTITTGDGMRPVVSEPEGVWCAACLRAWDERMGFSGA